MDSSVADEMLWSGKWTCDQTNTRKTYHAPNGYPTHGHRSAQENDLIEQSITGCSAVDQFERRGGTDKRDDITQSYESGVERAWDDLALVLSKKLLWCRHLGNDSQRRWRATVPIEMQKSCGMMSTGACSNYHRLFPVAPYLANVANRGDSRCNVEMVVWSVNMSRRSGHPCSSRQPALTPPLLQAA